MSLSTLLYKLQPELNTHIAALESPLKSYNLFFSISDGEQRAQVINVTADTIETAWEKGAKEIQALAKKQKLQPCWLRVDWVKEIKEYTWQGMKQLLSQTKRNYFRYGIALDSDLQYAFLEQELNANAMLYMGSKIPHAQLNEKNFSIYAQNRYHKNIPLSFSDEQTVYRLTTQGVFCGDKQKPVLLHDIGLNAGRRIIDSLDANQTRGMIKRSSEYLAGEVTKSGRFNYGWHPCFNRSINTYNTLRHASSTYAMLEGWEETQDEQLKAAITRSIHHLCTELIKEATLDDGQQAAFLTEENNEIKLGGNAVCLLALTKYTELTGDEQYLPLLERLALGIQYMQNPETGKFSHVLNYPELTVKEEFRIIYYDGEAAFGLMRLYGLTKDARWLAMVEKAFDHFIASDHWKAHDHWLSYCVNELTLYQPEERYYQFGIQNVAGYLDFVQERITTFPTLLELMMAAHKMIDRLQQQPEFSHLLEQIDLEKFDQALQYRAHYLMNGHFWPENAMFFKKPNSIEGSFFIRHHAFRVRIDDVEHYLSGYVAYLHYYLGEKTILDAKVIEPETINKDTEVPEILNEEAPSEEAPSESKEIVNEEKTKEPITSVFKTTYSGGINWTATRLQIATKGEWLCAPGHHAWRATGLCIHPPTFQPGEIVAIRPEGEKRYIHKDALATLPFTPQAILTQDDWPDAEASSIPILKVANIGLAIMKMGEYARAQIQGKVIGITGSSGKTTTVAMLNQALSPYGKVAQTSHNANLPKGTAWNLASIPWDSDYVILEMAIGGMEKNTKMVCPNIAVFTNVAPAHLTFHNSTEEIARKKSRIFSAMESGSFAIINRDMDEWPIVEKAALESKLNIISFGQHSDSDIRLLSLETETGLINISIKGKETSLSLASPSMHMAINTLACLAVTEALEIQNTPAQTMLSFFKPIAGRGEEIKVNIHGYSVRVINDAYNANPVSMKASLQAFSGQNAAGRKVLILGDMLELAENTDDYHEQLVPDIIQAKADTIFLTGEHMEKIHPLLKEAGITCHFRKNIAMLQAAVVNYLKKDDLALFKSSNGIGLHKIVKHLIDLED